MTSSFNLSSNLPCRLTVSNILEIHAVVCSESPKRMPTGYKEKIIDMLISEHHKKSHGVNAQYKTVYEQAAALMLIIIKQKPFANGNKRTALLSACVYLAITGIRLDLPSNAADMVLSVASKPGDDHVPRFAEWFKNASY